MRCWSSCWRSSRQRLHCGCPVKAGLPHCSLKHEERPNMPAALQASCGLAGPEGSTVTAAVAGGAGGAAAGSGCAGAAGATAAAVPNVGLATALLPGVAGFPASACRAGWAPAGAWAAGGGSGWGAAVASPVDGGIGMAGAGGSVFITAAPVGLAGGAASAPGVAGEWAAVGGGRTGVEYRSSGCSFLDSSPCQAPHPTRARTAIAMAPMALERQAALAAAPVSAEADVPGATACACDGAAWDAAGLSAEGGMPKGRGRGAGTASPVESSDETVAAA